MNLLFTNAGRRTYLIEDALALNEVNNLKVSVFVCDTSPLTASMLVRSKIKTFLTPRVSDNPEHYVSVLQVECQRHEIDVIIPLMDFELLVLSAHKEKFKAIGTEVIVSPSEIIKVTLDKQLCWHYCKQHGLDMPNTWFSGEVPNRNKVPLISKRTFGSGSVDLTLLLKSEHVPDPVPPDFLVQEMVNGQEYGIDVLNDLDGGFVHCCARRKIMMRCGETDKAEVVYGDQFNEIGRRISAAFRHVGNLDADCIIDSSGRAVFLDFNPRFGGGYPFTHAAGFDYLRTLLELLAGVRPQLPARGKRIVGAKGFKLFTMEAGE